MRLHELTERGQGADGASELLKRKTDPTSPQNKNKLKKLPDQHQPGAGTGPNMQMPQSQINNNSYNQKNNNDKYKKNKYNLLMIRRKHSLGYVEFLRGKYTIKDIDYIKSLFFKMTVEEINKLKSIREFNKLRINLGMENKKKKYYKSEYENAEIKFNYLLRLNLLDELIDEALNNKDIFNEPEWEIPKGKRQNKETDLQCAMREFTEESGIPISYLKIFKNVIPLEEIYTGSNGINYKNTFFFAELTSIPNNIFDDTQFIKLKGKDDVSITNKEDNVFNMNVIQTNIINKNNINLNLNYFNIDQKKEVGKINILDENECINKLKLYQLPKKNIISKSFQIINQYKYYFDIPH